MVKIWTTAKADKVFSVWIRQRDGKCVYPGCSKTEYLQNSHFWARANSATRYDPENCDTLCYQHHYGDRTHGWEFNKQGAYREFKIKQLGKKKYDALQKRAESVFPRKDAIIACMILCG